MCFLRAGEGRKEAREREVSVLDNAALFCYGLFHADDELMLNVLRCHETY